MTISIYLPFVFSNAHNLCGCLPNDNIDINNEFTNAKWMMKSCENKDDRDRHLLTVERISMRNSKFMKWFMGRKRVTLQVELVGKYGCNIWLRSLWGNRWFADDFYSKCSFSLFTILWVANGHCPKPFVRWLIKKWLHVFQWISILKPNHSLGDTRWWSKNEKDFYTKVTGSYLAVFNSGWVLPTNFLKCIATLATSSLSSQRRLRNDVG